MDHSQHSVDEFVYARTSSSRPSSFYGQLLCSTSSKTNATTSGAATALESVSASQELLSDSAQEPATPRGADRRALSPLPTNKLHGFKPSPSVMTSPPYLPQYQDNLQESSERTPFTSQRPLSIGSVSDFSSPTHRAPPASGRSHRRTRSRIAAPIGELGTLDSMGLAHPGSMSPPTPLSSPRLDTYAFNRPPSSAGFAVLSAATSPPIGLGIISAPPTPPSEQLASLQDIFVALAHKERTVLEARQALDEAWEDLKQFRSKLNSTLGPATGPLVLLGQPQIISRHFFPNLGINALYLEADLCVGEADFASAISAWDIDESIHYSPRSGSSDLKKSLASRFVVFILDVLHCIITTTLPTVQTGSRGASIPPWRPVYPSPTQTLLCPFKSS